MSEKVREITNYEPLIRAITDATTKHTYPEAVVVFEELLVRLSSRVVKCSLAVYPSVEAFEAGGQPIALLGEKVFLGDEFDALLASQAALAAQIQAAVIEICAAEEV
jgi:hypothetical protein